MQPGLSSAAASAAFTGPLVPNDDLDAAGLVVLPLCSRSADTSTSTRMTRSSSFSSRVIFSVYVGAKLIRQIAMSGLDDNIHVYLHRGVGSSNGRAQASMRPAFGTDRGQRRGSVQK